MICWWSRFLISGPSGGSIETECCGCRGVDGGMRHASSSRRQRNAESDFLLPPALNMADGRVNSSFALVSKPVRVDCIRHCHPSVLVQVIATCGWLVQVVRASAMRPFLSNRSSTIQ